MAPLYFGLAAVAAATLLYELVLTRLFAIAHGYHFAFLAISLALLGFGASSNVLAFRRGAPRLGGPALPWLAATGAVGLVASYVAANAIPFDPYRVAWEPRQTAFLAAYLLALAAPFFLLGLVQGLPLTVWPERASRLYAAALAGSGLGCVGALASLEWTSGPRAVVLAGLVAACGSVAFAVAERSRLAAAPLPAAAVLVLAVLLWQTPSWLDLRLSPYKPLSQLLEYPGTRVLHRDSNALSRVDVVESPGIRSAPGLSLAYTRPPPRQSALILDGDTLLPLTGVSRDFFDALPASLPYHLRPRARVLVVTPGGGMDVHAALAGGAASVVAVEDNPLVADLAASRFATRAGGVYGDRRVRLATSAPRAYLARSSEHFDVIDVALTGNYRPVTAGAFSLSETSALTEEAFAAYVDHLAPSGLLVVQRWLQLPPTEELRAAALVAAALGRAGADPRRSMVAIRSFSTMLLVARTSPFSERELAAIKSFARERRFDLVHYPGIRAHETNRFNVLRRDPYFASVRALLADPGRFFERYGYDVRPPTDNRPFFFHFFKLAQTRTVLSLLGKTWQPFGGSGYLILVGLLGLVILLAILLLLIPLALPMRRVARASGTGGWAWTTAYFSGLGLGFLLVEVALVQRAIVFLDHPAYALGVVLFGVLTWSSVGSMLSALVPWRTALAAAALAAAVYPTLLARVFDLFLDESLGIRIAVMLVLLAPLGLLLGVPFPRGLAVVGRTGPDWLPLAWGVNGFASVVGAVLAALIALSFGLAAVFRTGAVAYAIALVALVTVGPERAGRRGRQ